MKTIIVGGGKVGFYLAKTLREHDQDIVLIEQDKVQCHYCANNLDIEIFCGDGTTAEALRNAKADKADAVIAVMGKDENNLVCCQLAKKLFNVRKTIAKVNNPKNAAGVKQLGVDIVISATDSIIQLMEHEVDLSSVKELIPLDGGEASILEITLPENYSLSGTMLLDMKLPESCNIVCIKRNGRLIIPRGRTTLQSNDVMLVVTLEDAQRELRKILHLKG